MKLAEVLGPILFLGMVTTSQVASESPEAYRARITKWRSEVEASLKTPEGWLSVCGLTWLRPGESTIGSADSNDVVLPTGSAPAVVGSLTLNEGQVVFKAASGVSALIGGNATAEKVLAADSDRVKVGSLTFMVIRRGMRTGVRVFNSQSKAQKEFKGLHWYPIDPKMVVHAQYTAYDHPKSMPITNVIGDTQPVPNPGYVTFTLHGKPCRLEAQSQGGGFFFNFHDETSGKTTYPAGRFLDASGPINGEVVLDFNQATNPPCAFTNYATCPLPPKENFLSVAIAAGEKVHHPAE